jgi:hypothetical protein
MFSQSEALFPYLLSLLICPMHSCPVMTFHSWQNPENGLIQIGRFPIYCRVLQSALIQQLNALILASTNFRVCIQFFQNICSMICNHDGHLDEFGANFRANAIPESVTMGHNKYTLPFGKTRSLVQV